MKFRKWIRCTAGVALCMGVGAIPAAWAQGNVVENGNFETGDLAGWDAYGNAGVLEENVLEGHWSAFITTGEDAVGGASSFLQSVWLYPTKPYTWVTSSFLVRYKTNEDTGGSPLAWDDPFHAELVTGLGAVDLVTIKTDGISWSGMWTTVTDVDAGLALSPLRPTVPTFESGTLFDNEAHTLLVRTSVPVYVSSPGSCDPVLIKFSISDWADTQYDSAAFIDDVKVSFVPAGGPLNCPPPVYKALRRR